MTAPHPPRRTPLRRVLPPVAALALPAAVGAQAAATTGGFGDLGPPAAACAARIPAGSMVRVTVYLQATVVDPADRPLLPAADLLAQLASERVRALLGATPGTLPRGDSAVAWTALADPLRVTVHRDGRFTLPASADRAALLPRAIADLAAGGERVFWPDGHPGDSAAVELRLHRPVVDPGGAAEPLRLRVELPLFSLPVPRSSPVVQTRPPRIAYPESSLRGGAVGTVILEFVVDSTGRVDPATVREVWAPERPRLTGEVGRFYDAFVRSAVRGLSAARYEPTRIGGCVVRWLVRQEFDYGLR